jgi:exoribonuclease II
MDANQRKLAIVTSLGKKYSGMVDVPGETFRTTDLLNSANIFWKSPNLKCYDNAIFMSDVRLFLDDKAMYKKFDFIQVKLSDII